MAQTAAYRLRAKLLPGFHRLLLRASGGRIGRRFGKVRILLLTTSGRKSGRKHTVPLAYLPDGDRMVIIGSNWGSDRHPQWWLNLRQQPRAEVQLGRRRGTVVAQEASPEEKERLWPRIVDMYPGYEAYRAGTNRDIPVVLLAPEQ